VDCTFPAPLVPPAPTSEALDFVLNDGVISSWCVLVTVSFDRQSLPLSHFGLNVLLQVRTAFTVVAELMLGTCTQKVRRIRPHGVYQADGTILVSFWQEDGTSIYKSLNQDGSWVKDHEVLEILWQFLLLPFVSERLNWGSTI
jgi:hypothetical protein